MKIMKQVLFFLAMAGIVFTGCPMPDDPPENPSGGSKYTLTIKNESSYGLSNVKWAGKSFTVSGAVLAPTGSATQDVSTDDSGYIFFTRKDIGIECRTAASVTIPWDGPFVFNDNTTVVEVANTSNSKTLSTINFTSKLEIITSGRAVAKNDTVNTGEAVTHIKKTITLTLKNTGVGNLMLTGNEPVKSTDPAFIITQPSSSNIAVEGAIDFTVAITLPEEKEYTTTITVKSNDPAGDFTFTLLAKGVKPKSIITVWQGDRELVPNETIDMGEVTLGKSGAIEITVKNTGVATLTLDPGAMGFSGDDAALFTIDLKPPADIAAGKEAKFTVRYTPLAAGPKQAKLTIPNNDTSHTNFGITIKGTAKREYPVMEIKNNGTAVINETGEIQFGVVDVGTTKNLTFTVTNKGPVDLKLSGTPVIGISGSSAFTVSAQPARTTIAPDDSITFNLLYTPQAEETHTATVGISSDTQSGYFSFKITGSGYAKKPEMDVKQDSKAMGNHSEFDFGDTTADKPKTLTFTVGNTGDANLTFVPVNENRVSLTDNADGFFTVIQQPMASTIVTPGNTTTFILQFKPTRAGSNFRATVTIKTNSRSNDEFVFTVKGGARAANTESRLNALAFTKGKLDQAFNANITAYTLKIDASETFVNVIPSAMDSSVYAVKVNGKDNGSGVKSDDIILASTSVVTIAVTAEDETTTETYTVTINRITNYSSTALSHFTISNMDGTDVEDAISWLNKDGYFWQSLPNTKQLKFKPELVNSNATITVNNGAITNGVYSAGYDLLPGKAETVFNFTITAEDGNSRNFKVPCQYLGVDWEKVGDLPSTMAYIPQEITVVDHNNQFILTNVWEVYASSDGKAWKKTYDDYPENVEHYRQSSVVFNNTIYTIGGIEEAGKNWVASNIVSKSTNGTNWLMQNVTGLTGGVQNHTTVVFNGALWTMGGGTQTADETNNVWKSSNGAAWTKQTTPQWGTRAGHGSVVFKDKLFVMGGYYDDGNSEYRDVWSSANGTSWLQETSSAGWTGRNDFTVNATSAGLWLVGGNDGYFRNDVWFSPDGKTWTLVLEDAGFPVRATHAAVVRDGYLYLFGGVGGTTASWDDTEGRYDVWRAYIGE
jgi:hypothetical protein